ncbi:MAG TPA: hypothetical protein VFW96_21420 [Thermomicrobiales bacterium]|nr:hypothetical protein [Thermomicrobiales bacterium]
MRTACDERLVARGNPKQVARVAAARPPVVLMVPRLQQHRAVAPAWAAARRRHRP